jgi:hypothetical protein
MDIELYKANSNQLKDVLSKLENVTVLELEETINEARIKAGTHPTDNRTYISAGQPTLEPTQAMAAYGPGSAGSFGGFIRAGLSGLGVGYSAQVVDFGEVVSVTVSHTNTQTGKSASQSFVIIWRGPRAKYVYTVYSSSARYRHCNDYNQAISFIRSKTSALAGRNSGAA